MAPHLAHPMFLIQRFVPALVLVFAAAQLSAQQAIPETATGREIFLAGCANCHSGDGRGVTQAQVGFSDPLPDFTDCSYASREAHQDWETLVREGGGARALSTRMPAFGGALSKAQIARVVSYIHTLCHDKRWPSGDLNLPRAIATEKAFPEDETVLTTSATTRHGEGSVVNTVVYEKRIGPRSQLEIALPFVIHERAASERGGWTGAEIGDIALALKRTVYVDGRRGSILSLGAEAALPTGDVRAGSGSGTTVFEPFLLAAQILPRTSFIQMQTGVGLPVNTAKAEREAFLRVALGTTVIAGITHAFTPIAEFEAVRPQGAGSVAEYDAIPQMKISLSKRQHVAASLGMRLPLESSRRPKQFVAYFMWDWYEGGLFAGW